MEYKTLASTVAVWVVIAAQVINDARAEGFDTPSLLAIVAGLVVPAAGYLKSNGNLAPSTREAAGV